ncbi:hypothetical protein [Dactylosporangium sp. NPDC050588]|uniref:hypothetical protein n=1 Tax=Dactylosporangium sp. NPDC050588 TaxID=3157211 RepID=UPI0033DD7CEA
MTPEELLTLARSASWADRAQAGRGLSGFVGDPQVDEAVRYLLLNAGDTAVIDATAEALLERGDVAALRLFAYAWKRADGEYADHLSSALSGLFFTLSCGSPADRDRFRSLLHELLADVDVTVRDGAQNLLTRLDWVRFE